MGVQACAGRYWRAVAGQSGGGDRTHGPDLAPVELPGVDLLAVAGPDGAGRQRAAASLGATRAGSSVREPPAWAALYLVTIAPHWPDEREAVVVAAAASVVEASVVDRSPAGSLARAARRYRAHYQGDRGTLPLRRGEHPLARSGRAVPG
jgi:hypothetical protein